MHYSKLADAKSFGDSYNKQQEESKNEDEMVFKVLIANDDNF